MQYFYVLCSSLRHHPRLDIVHGRMHVTSSFGVVIFPFSLYSGCGFVQNVHSLSSHISFEPSESWPITYFDKAKIHFNAITYSEALEKRAAASDEKIATLRSLPCAFMCLSNCRRIQNWPFSNFTIYFRFGLQIFPLLVRSLLAQRCDHHLRSMFRHA